MQVAGWLLILAWGGTVLWYGGMGDQARALAMAMVAAGLAVAALAQRRSLRPPALAWWWPLALVAVLPPLVQALPLGIGHPWSAADRAALGVEPAAWAVDADAALRAAAWAIGWSGAGFLALLAWRGERAWRLAGFVVATAALHALAAPILAVLVPDWPSPSFAGRVRGTFVYPNHAAGLWAACLPLALALSRADRERRKLWLGATAALATALVLSASRGGILVGLVVCLPFAWSALPRRRRWVWASVGVIAVGMWLGALNLEQVQRRFEALGGNQAASLNGRVLIWTAAAPQAVDAGAFGAGPGAEPLAFLRGGTGAFDGLIVDRLHSDPLEWWVCYGWVGVVALLAAIVVALAWARRAWRAVAPDNERRARQIALGAGGGLAVLVLHSVAEFTWHSPALALLGALLAAIAAGSLGASADTPPRAAWRWRVGALAAALLLAGALVVEWPRASEDALAWQAQGDAAARQQAALPITGAASVRTLLSTPLHSATAAVTAAELALVAGDGEAERAIAHAALRVVALRSPGQPMAWVARLRLALADHDPAMQAIALERLMVWAPAWRPTREAELQVLLSEGGQTLSPERRQAALRSALGRVLPVPSRVLTMAESELGRDETARLLGRAEGRLRWQAELWLRSHGTLEEWLALRARLDPQRRPSSGWLLSQALGEQGVQVPRTAEGRWQMAHALGAHRLPLPPSLVTALAGDGIPGSLEAARWPMPGMLVDQTWLQGLAAAAPRLSASLHVPGVRALWEESLLAGSALEGRYDGLTRQSWPPLIAFARDRAALPLERARLTALLAAQAIRGWDTLPDGQGRAYWWSPEFSAMPKITSQAWVGLAIDGVWIGCRRGTFTPPTPDTPGPHRIQVLFP